MSSDTGEAVLITGAAQGLGQAIAARLGREGYRLALLDRQETRLHAVAQEMSAQGQGLVSVWPTDLLAAEQLKPLVERIEQECGPLVGLVNNAGICITQSFLSATIEDWQTVFGVNVLAPFVLMQAVGERMAMRGRGAIVNVASVAGRSARPDQPLYGASKAALLHLTKSAAAYFGPQGVRVNAICPGVLPTEMTERIWRQRQPEAVQRVLQAIPLKRLPALEEVAAVVAWLLSDEASYVNGQALNVCGGLEMD
ncbi:SDR family NAD(P)-dependent oxidoreductase [Thermogemmatispora carboxidivorans]|uniref:SDR family NAD(P)-dependent oxidoreductase n=1 Tax=Thermogemmatispora carboxidivorans TaxID=1382306 RepID=UPI00069CBD99|nr:SDR family oxidoreductase [Thermogemmatispora carboxidivorans]